LARKYTNIFHSKALQNIIKLVWNYTIWQPWFWASKILEPQIKRQQVTCWRLLSKFSAASEKHYAREMTVCCAFPQHTLTSIIHMQSVVTGIPFPVWVPLRKAGLDKIPDAMHKKILSTFFSPPTHPPP
jgi:hypothetical protein